MLTRQNTKLDWSSDDVDWDAVMEMTPEQEAAEDAQMEREMATFSREHAAKLRALTTLQRYRYERYHLLVSLLRCRVRIHKYEATRFMGFMVARETALLKRRQTQLLDWRRFLVSGVEPIYENH